MTTYVEVIERETTITIDGYSSAKTLLGVMRDISRVVRKYNEGEAVELLIPAKESYGGWYCEVEEVPCASIWNEEKDETEYREGYNYYFCTRFVK